MCQLYTSLDDDGSQTEANGSLIEAAPDLLRALKRITDLYELFLKEKGYDHETINGGQVGQARSAIAKALG